MKRRNVWGVIIGFILTSAWCLWLLIGFVGHVIPAIGIQRLSWSGNGNVFPSFDLVEEPIDLVIAAVAFSLIALQVIALKFRSALAALLASIPMFLLGLPLFLLPLSRDDGDTSFVEYCFVIAFCGTFLFGGASMLTWSRSLSKKPD